MGNLTNALQELRAERSSAQSQVQKLDQQYRVIESLNGLRIIPKNKSANTSNLRSFKAQNGSPGGKRRDGRRFGRNRSQ